MEIDCSLKDKLHQKHRTRVFYSTVKEETDNCMTDQSILKLEDSMAKVDTEKKYNVKMQL